MEASSPRLTVELIQGDFSYVTPFDEFQQRYYPLRYPEAYLNYYAAGGDPAETLFELADVLRDRVPLIGAVHQAQVALRCGRRAECPSKWAHPSQR